MLEGGCHGWEFLLTKFCHLEELVHLSWLKTSPCGVMCLVMAIYCKTRPWSQPLFWKLISTYQLSSSTAGLFNFWGLHTALCHMVPPAWCKVADNPRCAVPDLPTPLATGSLSPLGCTVVPCPTLPCSAPRGSKQKLEDWKREGEH